MPSHTDLRANIDEIFENEGRIVAYGDFYQTEVLEKLKEELEALLAQQVTAARQKAVSENIMALQFLRRLISSLPSRDRVTEEHITQTLSALQPTTKQENK